MLTMFIGRLLLVQVQLKEFAMLGAFKVFVTILPLVQCLLQASKEKVLDSGSRVELLEVCLDNVVLRNFDECFIPTFEWDEIAFALERAKIDLADKLHGVGWFEVTKVSIVAVAGLWRGVLREGGPGHEVGELGFMVKGPRTIRLSGSTAEEVGHCNRVKDGRGPERF